MAKAFALVIAAKDVSYAWSGSSTGLRSKATRSSRADVVTGSRVSLTHRPTGVVVTGEVPRGNHSRAAMQRHVAELRAKLFVELNSAVARKMRLPGR
jgi:hypothetical protein